ncbi:adenylate/guanylate cyclase domain-containing protein [Synechococcus sp. RSCCF101]|uniref:adenylate/guanylate cyclase domain-containing protein n=1 Tax=Synechococcus sp. RSCCF101 TaxID=2511069 RepID=UPI001247B045|nr:adenylate/guanylate cyclase domain-containing protein [Synechococcus sp. RSCCF101]QEY32783.1 adenylate/guanylate cyclase domain-containing protein [Synechococcus sp. RSCCF101]
MGLRRPGPLVVVAVVLSAAAAALGACPARVCRPWRAVERNLEDQVQRWRGPRRAPAEIVQVVIDDATLAEGEWQAAQDPVPPWAEGLEFWPWPRARYIDLVTPLLEAGAEVVALNVVFAGPSGRGPEDERLFRDGLARRPQQLVLAAEMVEIEDALGAGGLALLLPDAADDPRLPWLGLGLSNVFPPVRGGRFLQPAHYVDAAETPPGAPVLRSLPEAILRQADRRVADDLASQSINFYGPEPEPTPIAEDCAPSGEGFLRLSAKNVIDPQQWALHPCRRRLDGALVIVGSVIAEGGSALGALPSPFGPVSGVEVLATATANAALGDGLRSWPLQPAGRGALTGAVVLAGLLLALSRDGLSWRLTVPLACALVWFALVVVLMDRRHVWLPLLTPPASFVVSSLAYGAGAFRRTALKRRLTRRWLERCVDPAVVGPMLSEPEDMEQLFAGRLLPVSVLFSDLQGFTQLTRQRTRDGQVQEHLLQLNSYLDRMRSVVWRHGGFLDKFIGDAVMAVFGVPRGRGEAREAEAALRCALDMQQELEALNRLWSTQGLRPLGSGIGIASGSVVAGGIGGAQLGGLSVIGDTVNLASRLEGLTRSVQVDVLVDGETARLVQPCLPCRSLGPREVKGMGPVEVFTLEGKAAADGAGSGAPQAPAEGA